MEDQNLHYRHIMLFYLKKKVKMHLKRPIKCVLCTESIQLRMQDKKKTAFRILFTINLRYEIRHDLISNLIVTGL